MLELIFWTKYDDLFLFFNRFQWNFQGLILMSYGPKICWFQPGPWIIIQSVQPNIKNMYVATHTVCVECSVLEFWMCRGIHGKLAGARWEPGVKCERRDVFSNFWEKMIKRRESSTVVKFFTYKVFSRKLHR